MTVKEKIEYLYNNHWLSEWINLEDFSRHLTINYNLDWNADVHELLNKLDTELIH